MEQPKVLVFGNERGDAHLFVIENRGSLMYASAEHDGTYRIYDLEKTSGRQIATVDTKNPQVIHDLIKNLYAAKHEAIAARVTTGPVGNDGNEDKKTPTSGDAAVGVTRRSETTVAIPETT